LICTMTPPKRDVAWEYARQKEKLDVLEQELKIQAKIDKEKELQDKLNDIDRSIGILEKEWLTRSSQWGWRSWTAAQQKFQLLSIKSKLRKQRSDKLSL